eukprot:TRINITY_DN7782_c0_g1_i3.p1 TRINITY_DN7782_c0_g1~~TRINITY_DN7782_c0_g1_i3.p1  ORF type:complete len:116 (+),score=2.86 TRINITY_DN7782_c0_g1_i3:98-445(+)
MCSESLSSQVMLRQSTSRTRASRNRRNRCYNFANTKTALYLFGLIEIRRIAAPMSISSEIQSFRRTKNFRGVYATKQRSTSQRQIPHGMRIARDSLEVKKKQRTVIVIPKLRPTI